MMAALRKAVIGILAVIPVLGLSSPAVSQGKEDASEGRRIFNSYCFLCHGGYGFGGGILARKLEIVDQVVDLTSEPYASMDDTELANLIGGYDRSESLMPKWGELLSQEELSQVAAYVKSLSPRASYQIGKNLYFRHCASCHGSNRKGGGAIAKQIGASDTIPDLSSAAYRSMPVQDMVASIRSHDSVNNMVPNFGEGFTDRALNNLAAYLVVYSASSLSALGDTENGERIFKQNCIACHGTSGKGDGVLANLLDVEMVDLTSASQLEASDMQLVHTITRGRGSFMPAWFGELNQHEIRDVAAYVRSLYKPEN